jgi:hypothetical protein
VREVLNYVQFSADELVSRLRRDVETALRGGWGMRSRRLKFYEEGCTAIRIWRMYTSSDCTV